MEYMLLLLIPLMAWADRQRGSAGVVEAIPKWAALTIIGVCSAVLTGHYWDWQFAVITAAVWIGFTTGFGHPLGTILGGLPNKRYEWWQRGALRTNPWLALFVRGAMVGGSVFIIFLLITVVTWLVSLFTPCAVLVPDYFAALKITIAFAIAFPMAPFIVTKGFQKSGDPAWAEQEYWRNGIAGLILWSVWWIK